MFNLPGIPAPPPGAPPAAPPPGAPPAVAKPTLAHQFITLPDGTQAVGDLTQNPDGTFTVASGNYAGLTLNAQRQPDPQSLSQVQAVQKGQSQPGGLPPGSYSVNPDGTLKIINSSFGPVGTIVAKNGQYLNPDGTPYLAVSGDPSTGRWTVRQPDGTPATQNPNFKSNTITNLITKDNPIAGTANAIVDAASGQYKKAASDFGAGTSGGTLPQVDANGNIVPGDTTKAAATDIGVPNGVPGVTSPITGPGGIGDNLSSLLKGLGVGGGGGGGVGSGGADTKAETDRANALADALGGQANAAGAQADVDRGFGTQTRAQQEDSIAGLQAAANGTAPSAAELQLKQQAGIDAARQYGLAAALQGNNPGAALRQASLGSAQIAGTTNQNAAINRANEQATARGQLASTLANVRSGDQGAVNTDVGQQGTLTQGQLTSQGQGVTSTGQQVASDTAKYAADQQKEGAIAGAIGTGVASILSDKRAKRDVARTDLADALAKGVHGVSFKYIPEAEEDEEPHFGILADALEKVIPGTVSKGARGYKEVNTGHLTMANTAVISELARRLQDLEKGARK